MNVRINDKTFRGEVMSTPEDIRKGMMGKSSLDGCMIFQMGRGTHSFWMKNCLIELDIIFVLNKKITHIHPNCPVPDSHRMNPPRYMGIGDHVIEFPAGTASNFRVGDKVNMY